MVVPAADRGPSKDGIRPVPASVDRRRRIPRFPAGLCSAFGAVDISEAHSRYQRRRLAARPRRCWSTRPMPGHSVASRARSDKQGSALAAPGCCDRRPSTSEQSSGHPGRPDRRLHVVRPERPAGALVVAHTPDPSPNPKPQGSGAGRDSASIACCGTYIARVTSRENAEARAFRPTRCGRVECPRRLWE